ncbi:MAG TPA: efflux RND transporter periplasmic adaptor subunit [Spirochaetia bacterium]|nr:efflux RND transporter periplasmic adaptor subunit [Spirochaetia bacterium]
MNNKKPIIIVVAAMVVILAGIFGYYWYENHYYVSTDDAQVDYNIINLSPQITGRLVDIYVHEGDHVSAGEVVARVDDSNLPAGANEELAVVRAPIDGNIIKVLGVEGEMGVPGSPVVEMADLHGLYVTANVEETNLYEVKPGQLVTFTVDAFPGHTFSGRVLQLGEATAAEFSLLPQQNTSGSFTKVVQRVPVKVSIDNYQGLTLVPGMSTEVKIHIR